MHQISYKSMSKEEEYYVSEEEEDVGSFKEVVVDENDIKHIYRDEIWLQDYSIYDPPLIEFVDVGSNSNSIDLFSTILQLWKLFWPLNSVCKIIRETNCYVGVVIVIMKNTIEGPKRKPFTVVQLMPLLSIHIYVSLHQ